PTALRRGGDRCHRQRGDQNEDPQRPLHAFSLLAMITCTNALTESWTRHGLATLSWWGMANTLALLGGFPLDLRQLSAGCEVPTLAGADLDPHRKLAALGPVAHGELVCALQNALADLWDLQLVIPVDAVVVGGIGEDQRNEAPVDEVGMVDAGERRHQHRTYSQVHRRQGGMLARRPLPVVVPADDESAAPGFGPRAELRVHAVEDEL